jgi:cold shock CspA family protein
MDDTNTALKGTIKTWFEERGFGWIARDDGAPDIFLHVSDVAGDFEPTRDDRVAFAIGADRKGRPTAVKATSLEAKDGELLEGKA